MLKLLYVCFGNALSWKGLSSKYPELVEYLNKNYQLEILDYLEDSQNFENLLRFKEEEADIIIYDQTISSLSEAQNYPYSSGYMTKGQKVYLTLTGNLKPEEFIKDLKSLYE